MGDFTTVLCEMKDNRFYHLDTCFFPLSTELAMWFPPAFTEETQKRMKKVLCA
jgi:N-dimethylarginine dimethylaminohydrolase